MANMFVKTLTTNAYDTIRPFFDDVAEECSILSVSNDETTPTTLILTIDEDLIVSLAQTSSTYVPQRLGVVSVTFNGNLIASANSVTTGYNPIYTVLYSETFMFIYIHSTSGRYYIVYEKIGTDKFASGGASWDNYMPVKTLDNVELTRYPSLGYTVSDSGYLDYVDKTALSRTSVRYASISDHFVTCSNNGLTNGCDKIITMNNKDYYVLSPYLLIPIDDE